MSKAGFERINLIVGRTRDISSSAVIGKALGRVDCPPMSTRETPAERKRSSVGSSNEGLVECRPPSEKESGVRFNIAIIFVARVAKQDNIGGSFEEIGIKGESGTFGRGSRESCVRKVGCGNIRGGSRGSCVQKVENRKGSVASGIRLYQSVIFHPNLILKGHLTRIEA